MKWLLSAAVILAIVPVAYAHATKHGCASPAEIADKMGVDVSELSPAQRYLVDAFALQFGKEMTEPKIKETDSAWILLDVDGKGSGMVIWTKANCNRMAAPLPKSFVGLVASFGKDAAQDDDGSD